MAHSEHDAIMLQPVMDSCIGKNGKVNDFLQQPTLCRRLQLVWTSLSERVPLTPTSFL